MQSTDNLFLFNAYIPKDRTPMEAIEAMMAIVWLMAMMAGGEGGEGRDGGDCDGLMVEMEA